MHSPARCKVQLLEVYRRPLTDQNDAWVALPWCNRRPVWGYHADMQYRASIWKWAILVFAVLLTLLVLADKIAAYGSLAGGLWIAFAVLHAGDRLVMSRQKEALPPVKADA